MSSILYRLSQIAAVIYSCMASAYAALWLFGMPEVGLVAAVIAIAAAAQWLGLYLLRPVKPLPRHNAGGALDEYEIEYGFCDIPDVD